MAVQLVKTSDGWFQGRQNKTSDSFCVNLAFDIDSKTGQPIVVRIERPVSKAKVSVGQTTLPGA